MSRNYSIDGIRVGRAISVVHCGEVVKARVLRGGGSVRVIARLTKLPHSKFFVAKLEARDEGITWSRDWNGPASDALRVFTALTWR